MSDERAKMAQMNRWLDDVCAELDLDRNIMTQATGPMLALIKHVAHGPSRPGAPLTALAVGLASALAISQPTNASLGDGAGDASSAIDDEIASRIAALETLVVRWNTQATEQTEQTEPADPDFQI